ncbi:MAG: glycogen debranching protein GlgX [Gemmataceae bacterium]|nr:glycogen debranching protein GlgX [Gemmataceae bacterium]
MLVAPSPELTRAQEAPGTLSTASRPSLPPTTPGQCRPFGATITPTGVNFAVFSRHAERVHLVLFRDGQAEPFAELPLDPAANRTGDVWHIHVRGLPADCQYGYRVFGPLMPRAGHRFNSTAVLLDPYARAVSGRHPWASGDGALNGHGADSAKLTRRGRIVSDEFDWKDDAPPRTPLAQTIIYELHVRGYTRHPSSGVDHPGTFLGLTQKIPHLKSLGVTAVQLMPILEFDELDQPHKNPFTQEVLRNYWGYSPMSFFAPKASYAVKRGNQVVEFKEMVKVFHRAGIEVILDVVYNHTCEGNENGPSISFRGLDNAIYYMLDREGRCCNYSGCGNTLNCNHPLVHDLIIDSLTYMVSELHVDGFRFDLASILGRAPDGKALEEPPLLRHIAEHPVLGGVKLLAEPWDAAGLSQVGKFPTWGRWLELNGLFRDDVRRFVRSEPGAASGIAKRICGSLDVYGATAKHPYHSVNFVTCHDGFTLCDLVSYNHKHNWPNGENNRDGWDDNLSYNCGHEGATDVAPIAGLRQRQMRNFLALLMVSQGVPFLLAGDEFARSQQGNNNAYCQDNDVNWIDWKLAEKNAGLLRFARMMIALRKQRFAIGQDQFVNRVSWHGTRLGEPDWRGSDRALAFQVHGVSGQPEVFVIFNAHWEPQKFALPSHLGQWRWKRLVDTNLPSPEDIVEEKSAIRLSPADHYVAAPRSTVILIS